MPRSSRTLMEKRTSTMNDIECPLCISTFDAADRGFWSCNSCDYRVRDTCCWRPLRSRRHLLRTDAPPFSPVQVCPFCWNKLRENGQSCPGCRNLFTDAPRSAASAAEAEARFVLSFRMRTRDIASSEPDHAPPSPSSSFKKAKRAAASAPRPALRGDASVVRAAAAPTLTPRVEVVPSQTRQAANDSVQSIDQIRARLAARARDAIERAPEKQQQLLLQQQQQQQVIPATMTTTHVRLSSLAPAALTPAEEKLLGTLGKMQRLGLLRAGSTAEALFRQLSRQST